MVRGTLALLLGLSMAAGGADGDKPATLADQYQALLNEFHAAAHGLYKATTDEEREWTIARAVPLAPRLLELAEKNPNEPFVPDALVQVITQEIWLQNNTTHPGRGKDDLGAKAVALLLRDHIASEKLAEGCRRCQYGFGKECETFLRRVLEKSPRREVRGLACLRLAQYLHGRLRRLDVLRERPEMARRYEELFGKEYVAALRRRDRADATREAEAFFERAAREYGDVKVPYGGTVAEKAKSELYEIRHLSIGKEAPETEGEDQDGVRFKLSDYRGKVVLLYFWSEY